MNSLLVQDAVRVITKADRRRLESLLTTPIGRRCALSGELTRTLERAITVPAARVPQDVITMNSIVVCSTRARGGVEWNLVYPWDDDVESGNVSVLTPLGLALLGSRVGARLPASLARTATAPLAIARLLYQPEEAGDLYR